MYQKKYFTQILYIFLGKGKTKAGTMMMAKERMTKICLTFTPMNEGKNLPQKSMNSLLEIY